MGDTSGGTPGCSNKNDLMLLLQETRKKYLTIHPQDKRWPCPFCFQKEKTTFRAIMHVKKDHPNLANLRNNELISSFSENISQAELNDTSSSSARDLSQFLRLVNNEGENNSQS